MTCFYHLAELDGNKRTRAINHMECIMGERDAKKAEDSLNKVFTFMKMRCLGWVQLDYIEQCLRAVNDEFSDFFLRHACIMSKENEDGWIRASDVYRDYDQCVNDYLETITYEEDELIRIADEMGIIFDENGDPKDCNPSDKH